MKLAIVLLLPFIPAAGASAVELTWDNLRLPPGADRQQIGQYIADTHRLLSPPLPDSVRVGERRLAALRLDRAAGEKTLEALAAVPADHLDLILVECKRSEESVSPQTKEFTIETNFGPETVLGTQRALPGRTAFTRVALEHVVHVPEIPPAARPTIFKYWDIFPELIVAVSRRTWLNEGEGHLSVQLLQKFDRDTGWWETAPLWINYLIRLDSANSWTLLEHMMVHFSPKVQVMAYEAVKDLPAPKLDLDMTVQRAWKNYTRQPTGLKYPTPYARIAVRHGVPEAVVTLAKSIRDKAMKGSAELNGPVLLSVLARQFADPRAAAEFVVRNAKKLSFDSRTRKYDTPATQ